MTYHNRIQRKDNNFMTKFIHCFKELSRKNESGIFLALILIIVVIGMINPAIFSKDIIINNFRTTSFLFIIGIAMTFVLIAGGLDLSVGSTLALGGVMSGLAVTNGIPALLGVLIGIGVGAAIGLMNGLIIVKINIPPLIATLGMMYVVKGIVMIITQGAPVFPLPESFNRIGQGDLFHIPFVVIIAIILAVIAHVTLNKTRFGRAVYAIGGNEETARLSGINVGFTKIWIYIVAGAASGLSGVLMAARLASAQPNSGSGYELLVVTSVIIGGTSLFGGAGSILGTAIGTMFLTIVTSGMVLLQISVYWQNLVVGVIIILAVALDQFRRKRNGLI